MSLSIAARIAKKRRQQKPMPKHAFPTWMLACDTQLALDVVQSIRVMLKIADGLRGSPDRVHNRVTYLQAQGENARALHLLPFICDPDKRVPLERELFAAQATLADAAQGLMK